MKRISVKGSVKKVGDWKKAMGAGRSVAQHARYALDEFARNVGEEAERKLRQHIVAQDLGWTPLKKSTIAYKKRKRGTRPSAAWYFKGDMYKNIYSNYAKASKYVFIGVKSVKHSDSGQLLTQIARALEKGVPAKKIPARPLFQPTRDEIYKEIKDGSNPKLDLLKIAQRRINKKK